MCEKRRKDTRGCKTTLLLNEGDASPDEAVRISCASRGKILKGSVLLEEYLMQEIGVLTQ